MSQTVQLKIVGIDPKRYPKILNKNYIDIVYQLSEKAPKDWCSIFNDSFRSIKNVRIEADDGQYIETWVRDMDEIPKSLCSIKDGIQLCNEKYNDKLRTDEASRKASFSKKQSSASLKLEKILSALDFD